MPIFLVGVLLEVLLKDKCFTLRDAVKALLPELFVEKTLIDEEIPRIELEEESRALQTMKATREMRKMLRKNSVKMWSVAAHLMMLKPS
ncbi:hypothetical protein CK203_056751 [Vitis vinifera]|uniref:Uncharacterized protein n=1 Tax=Vitis vinifera TaxID=29760 RepID=A0A438GKG7_VITVI|nr:hypothetical protein CK203_056751 [Vitis vinifera]